MLCDALRWLWDLLNSNFGTAAVGALFGAWGGAYAAQKIAERSKARDQLLEHLQNTNAAIELAGGICVAYLNLKKQHVRDLRATYDEQRAAVIAHRPGTPLNIGRLDLQAINPPQVRIGRLDEVMTKIPVLGRPKTLVGVLAMTITSLNHSFETWNGLVAAFHQLPGPFDEEKAAIVFGLPRNGVVDERFKGTVEAFSDETDHCIFFSKLLVSDLTKAGERMRRNFKRKFGRDYPVQKFLWHQAEEKGLFPPDEDFETWFKNFWDRVPRTQGRRLEKLSYATRRLWRRSSMGKVFYWLSYMPQSAER